MQLLGYADRLSVHPGGRLEVMVSSAAPAYEAALVRLRRVDDRPGGPGYLEEPVASAVAGRYEGREYPLPAGSYGRADLAGAVDAGAGLTLGCRLWPTLPVDGREQGLLAVGGASGEPAALLGIDGDGRLLLRVSLADGGVREVRSDAALEPRSWYFAAGAYDAETGEASLWWRRTSGWPVDGGVHRSTAPGSPGAPEPLAGPLLLAATGLREVAGIDVPGGTYNGKLEAPVVVTAAADGAAVGAWEAGEAPGSDVLAAWDLSEGIGTDRLHDRGPRGLHGRVVNMPARAVTGHRWTGREVDWRHAPGEYGAIHFHDDDLTDAGWPAALALDVADGTASGVYAVKLSAGDAEEYVPFYVAPPPGRPGADVLFLAPTNTYLAYANERLHDQHDYSDLVSEAIEVSDVDRFLVAHPELGLSLYDTHRDGSGVCYSSWRRPVLNMRPKYRTWLNHGPRHFAADFYVLGWLDHEGVGYDVATDEDLHRHGDALLDGYRVLVTGTHPEYWTGPMMDALEGWLARGGRLMYLGGNGFYWVTSCASGQEHVIEVRRGHAGTRCWESLPGEVVHSTTGETGGLWRYRGRLPQALVGVGFCSQGWGGATGYARTEASRSEEMAFVFEGVEGDVIGESGLLLGGAAGDELDRADAALGTPSHATVLASSGPHTDYYQFAIEDLLMTKAGQGGSECPDVRADLTYLTTGAGGAVLSVGSINWGGALAADGHTNDVARVTGNVLRRFLA